MLAIKRLILGSSCWTASLLSDCKVNQRSRQVGAKCCMRLLHFFGLSIDLPQRRTNLCFNC